MATVEKALSIAARAHEGQTDKAGAPYILHPLRLMLRMDSPEARIAALLHDVVEDSAITLDDLRREGFSEAVLHTIDCLTRRDQESYEEFIHRLKGDPLARSIKIADLEDNLDIRRIDILTDRDIERLRKYHRAWKDLTGMVSGEE